MVIVQVVLFTFCCSEVDEKFREGIHEVVVSGMHIIGVDGPSW